MSAERSPGARAALVRAQRTALTVFLSVFVASWVIVGALLAPVTGGWVTIAAAALLLTVVPLAVLLRSRGSSHYPGTAIRLLVFRPMWYAQLLLILSALGGTRGSDRRTPIRRRWSRGARRDRADRDRVHAVRAARLCRFATLRRRHAHRHASFAS